MPACETKLERLQELINMSIMEFRPTCQSRCLYRYYCLPVWTQCGSMQQWRFGNDVNADRFNRGRLAVISDHHHRLTATLIILTPRIAHTLTYTCPSVHRLSSMLLCSGTLLWFSTESIWYPSLETVRWSQHHHLMYELLSCISCRTQTPKYLYVRSNWAIQMRRFLSGGQSMLHCSISHDSRRRHRHEPYETVRFVSVQRNHAIVLCPSVQ